MRSKSIRKREPTRDQASTTQQSFLSREEIQKRF
jgi:hypothetical protein